MRKGSNTLIRAIFALVLGIVLIVWPQKAVDYLILTIGVLFLVPGLITTIVYFTSNTDKAKGGFPLDGIGSILFGLILMIIPQFFADILTILLGLILMLGGIQQLFSLARAKKWMTVPFVHFIVPTLIFIAGAMVIANPSGTRDTALMVVGITALIYALFELINWFKFGRFKPLSDSSTVIELKDTDTE